MRAAIGKPSTTTLMSLHRVNTCAVIFSSLCETHPPACTPKKEERRSKETHTAEAFEREAALQVLSRGLRVSSCGEGRRSK